MIRRLSTHSALFLAIWILSLAVPTPARAAESAVQLNAQAQQQYAAGAVDEAVRLGRQAVQHAEGRNMAKTTQASPSSYSTSPNT